MKQREEVLNARLGDLLIARHPRWDETNVIVDSTRVIRGHFDWKIDVLVASRGQPVAIEAKRAEGRVVDLDAELRERLGSVVDATGDTIESGIAIVYPVQATAGNLESATFKYAVYQQQDADSALRWPKDGWTCGDIDQVATVLEIVSLSERRIRLSQQTLEQCVSSASEVLLRDTTSSTIQSSFGTVLHQQPGTQTTRMAVAILASALVFHYAIEGSNQVPPVDSGRGATGFSKSQVLVNWDLILNVNYWPIFSIARSLLAKVPTRVANPLLDRLNSSAEQLLNIGATTLHNLAGRMFQKLISDRKFLATFYTLPSSAALLAELAVSRLQLDWSDSESITELRIADFACGTGALLNAVQSAIYRRFRHVGGDDVEIHRVMMEKVILGTDIMPAATHLTANVLSSTHPGLVYDRSLIQVLPYGRDDVLAQKQKRGKNTVYIGALDLLGDEFMGDLLSEQGIELGGRRMIGRSRVGSDKLPVQHHSFDLVIMNPPFTRPNANRPKTDTNVPIPSFAGFETSDAEQWAMAQKLKSYPLRSAYGHAGLAAAFMDLAHSKLKHGGILALVLPLTFTSGHSWNKARSMLDNQYCDIDILSIASSANSNPTFSADTGIAECLVVARKKSIEDEGRSRVGYFSLPHRPTSLVEANAMAASVRSETNVKFGLLENSGFARLESVELGVAMSGLDQSVLKLPRSEDFHLPMTTVSKFAATGLDSQMINGIRQNGPFVIQKGDPNTKTFPALWSHHAGKNDGDRERKLEVLPDSFGIVRNGLDDDALDIWNRTASLVHANRDFRLNSQSLAMCVTPREVIGGRAWPSLHIECQKYIYPTVLWANSTLGLISFWWLGNRQQVGRVSLTLKKLPHLTTIDSRLLSPSQLAACECSFNKFKFRTFLPAFKAHHDPHS